MSYKLKLKTAQSFGRLDAYLKSKCIYPYNIRLGGFDSDESSNKKVIVMTFENRSDRDSIKAAFVERGSGFLSEYAA